MTVKSSWTSSLNLFTLKLNYRNSTHKISHGWDFLTHFIWSFSCFHSFASLSGKYQPCPVKLPKGGNHLFTILLWKIFFACGNKLIRVRMWRVLIEWIIEGSNYFKTHRRQMKWLINKFKHAHKLFCHFYGKTRQKKK